MPFPIAIPAAALAFTIAAAVRGRRNLMAWLGLTLALVPALFWLAFAIGEIVSPPH